MLVRVPGVLCRFFYVFPPPGSGVLPEFVPQCIAVFSPLFSIFWIIPPFKRSPSPSCTSQAGSYILASNTSNTVEFDMPAYPGLYPSFQAALSSPVTYPLLRSRPGQTPPA